MTKSFSQTSKKNAKQIVSLFETTGELPQLYGKQNFFGWGNTGRTRWFTDICPGQYTMAGYGPEEYMESYLFNPLKGKAVYSKKGRPQHWCFWPHLLEALLLTEEDWEGMGHRAPCLQEYSRFDQCQSHSSRSYYRWKEDTIKFREEQLRWAFATYSTRKSALAKARAQKLSRAGTYNKSPKWFRASGFTYAEEIFLREAAF
jgi:hypothetical protein